MGSTFFGDLFNSLATATQGIGNGVSNVLYVIMPLVEACFVLYVMMIVYSYWQNGVSLEGMFFDTLKRVAGIAVIIGIGINYSTYSSTVFPLVTDLGDGLASAWVGNTTTGSQLDAIVDKVAQITDTNSMDAETALNDDTASSSDGVLDGVINAVGDATSAVFDATIGKLGNTVTVALQNIMIWIASAIFLVVACAYLLVAQVTLILLAAVGPIFFAFALFPQTRQFFNNWIGTILNYGFLFLFMTISAEIFITYIDFVLDGWAADIQAGQLLHTTTLITLLSMFVVFAVMLLQIPSLTSSLFGGLSAGGFANAYATARNLKSMMPRVSGGRSGNNGGASGGSVKAERAGR